MMKTTDDLTEILLRTDADGLDAVLRRERAHMYDSERPFSEYMRRLIRAKGLRQQDVFLAADLPEGYGYKLISEERHTRQRDTILRLCFAAHCTLDEAQSALMLQGLSPLYVRLERDAALIVAFNRGMHEIEDVNNYLEQHGMDPLAPCGKL